MKQRKLIADRETVREEKEREMAEHEERYEGNGEEEEHLHNSHAHPDSSPRPGDATNDDLLDSKSHVCFLSLSLSLSLSKYYLIRF